MASVMTWDGLRDLAGFRSENGCAISVYLDLDPRTAPTAADVDARARSLLDRVPNVAGNGWSHERRVALREDVERIRRYVDEELDREGTLGLAVFCSSLDNLWRPLRLDERFDEQPRKHDQGGWSQANFQRHIENLVHEHVKAFAERLDIRVRRLRPQEVVVIC